MLQGNKYPFLDFFRAITTSFSNKSINFIAVLNIFDFHDEHTRKFESASFLEKSNLIELMYYEFIEGIPSPELYIKAATLFNLHNLPKEDLFIIRQDWHLIINKIKEGKAEEL